MRVLIDECLDWRLGRGLPGHEVTSVARMGWAGIKNGQLLALAEAGGFDVFLTGDRNLSFQQNLTGRRLLVIVLVASSTRLPDTLPLMTKVLTLLPTLPADSVTVVAP